MHGQAPDVFVSYKAEDRPRLAPLVEALEAEGFSVWWDAHIGGGTNWREDIEDHLDAAKCVVVAWSKRSVGPEGEFVRDEAMRAKRRQVYVPVRIDDVEPPLGFGEVQALSLKGWKGDRSDLRFQAVADAVRARITGALVVHHHAPSTAPRLSRRAAIAGGIGIGAIGVAGAGGWLLLKPGAANAKRIAVLPFANMSSDREQAYFADGVAEELRAALSRIGLEVIGRSSSDAVKELDTKAAASKLDVAHILTGSVRRSADMIRVNAQLVAGKDGVERWAQSYDRAPGDAIKIQTDIATHVAQALSIALGQAGRAAIALGGTADSAAQDLMLQSRKLRRDGSTADALRKALRLADAAIARDPNYADAHVERALALNYLASNYPTSIEEAAAHYTLADEAANRALAIAPKLGSAHAVLAQNDQSRLKLAGVAEHLRQALTFSPDDLEVLSSAIQILAWWGGGQEALDLADRFIALDPLNPTAYRRKSEVHHALRQYAQSLETGRQALVLGSNSNARIWTGYSLLLMGRPGDAMAEFAAMRSDDPFRLTGEALVAARTRDRAEGERRLSNFYRQYGAIWSYQYAQIRAQLGQTDRAFAELGNAIAARDAGLIYLKADPFLDPIRGDPRYAALLRKLKFPS
jgi:serine/threonine-protein kinase